MSAHEVEREITRISCRVFGAAERVGKGGAPLCSRRINVDAGKHLTGGSTCKICIATFTIPRFVHASPCDEEPVCQYFKRQSCALKLTRCMWKRDKDEDRKEIERGQGGAKRDNGEARKIKWDVDG